MEEVKLLDYVELQRNEPAPAFSEEDLVTDARSGLTPAQMVERRLVWMLRDTPLPVSRLSMAGPRRVLS
jgi:hypothetical protein